MACEVLESRNNRFGLSRLTARSRKVVCALVKHNECMGLVIGASVGEIKMDDLPEAGRTSSAIRSKPARSRERMLALIKLSFHFKRLFVRPLRSSFDLRAFAPLVLQHPALMACA